MQIYQQHKFTFQADLNDLLGWWQMRTRLPASGKIAKLNLIIDAASNI
jgi:hypothetical protein